MIFLMVKFFSYENDDRVFVLSYDIICEILNVDFNKIKNKNNVNVMLTDIKSTNGCIYFLAQGNITFKWYIVRVATKTFLKNL